MDLNPAEGKNRLGAGVEFLEQDCSNEWPLPSNSLDCVFTSNFFEHLRGKDDLRRTLTQIYRCLRPGGRLICLGPNIRYLGGARRCQISHWGRWQSPARS
jgi:SAM-dependent methyltransferase